MTFSTFILLLVGRRPSLTKQVAVRDAFTPGDARTFTFVLRDVFFFTAVIESIGACLLYPGFVSRTSWAEALYLSLFHAVSAFCNAGFSLFSDSLSAYRDDWLTNVAVCLLIVSGGIGFLVLSELKRRFPASRRKWRRLSLHSRLVLSSTLMLIVLGALAFAFMEWDNTLSALSWPDRLLAALFQSVTARTAGFNTLPLGLMANETLFALIILMFIGASPGSCGGGIKTTTLSSLILIGVSRLRGYERPRVFKRTISPESTDKAISMVTVSIAVVTVGLMLLLMTEIGHTAHPESRGKFLELLFEVVSAFGTVGLSTGVTGTLSPMGKLIITAVMFVGRLGPMVIGAAVARRKAPGVYFAEETIMIG
jgi:trk system potassium uptake protein TrkH